MNLLDRVIASFAPQAALRRVQARAALKVYARYEAATSGRRASAGRGASTDADAAAVARGRLAYIARDMVRNTPFAARAQAVIANNVVGDGIIWKIRASAKGTRDRLAEVLKAHFDTAAIDADGRQNLYGLQRLAAMAMVESGEVLVRRRRRNRGDGLPLPFQIQLLEADYLDTAKDTVLADGHRVREGIEYNAIGQRVAYWLFDQHPGAVGYNLRGLMSRRIPASEILHLYRQDRPGQMRGVSWFAPIAKRMEDLGDYQDAQIMRQKIAACFAAFRVTPEAEFASGEDDDVTGLGMIMPGRVENLAPGEDIRFADPPSVDGYGEFVRGVLMSAASDLGITYEALTGDLSHVNFSSARMGRMEMDRNVSSWQWLLMMPQMLQPVAAWALEAAPLVLPNLSARSIAIDWVPPHRVLVDPVREIGAMRDEIRAGLASRQGKIRSLGFDPDEILAEQIEDMQRARRAGLVFDSDAGAQQGAALPQDNTEGQGNGSE